MMISNQMNGTTRAELFLFSLLSHLFKFFSSQILYCVRVIKGIGGPLLSLQLFVGQLLHKSFADAWLQEAAKKTGCRGGGIPLVVLRVHASR